MLTAFQIQLIRPEGARENQRMNLFNYHPVSSYPQLLSANPMSSYQNSHEEESDHLIDDVVMDALDLPPLRQTEFVDLLLQLHHSPALHHFNQHLKDNVLELAIAVQKKELPVLQVRFFLDRLNGMTYKKLCNKHMISCDNVVEHILM